MTIADGKTPGAPQKKAGPVVRAQGRPASAHRVIILVMTDEGMAISSIRQRTRGRSVCVRLSEHSRLGDRTATCTPPDRDQSTSVSVMLSCAAPPALSLPGTRAYLHASCSAAQRRLHPVCQGPEHFHAGGAQLHMRSAGVQ